MTLIEFLDRVAALAKLPREDRIRSAVADLKAMFPEVAGRFEEKVEETGEET